MAPICFLLGLVLVSIGAALVFMPAGLIVGGAALSAAAFLSYRGAGVRVDS